MLIAFIKIVHFVVCIGLIVIVLLQADKGEGLAGAFGGGSSNTLFGERGGGDFMTRFTTGMAIVFMITSLLISVYVPRWETPIQEITMEGSMPTPMPGMPFGVPMGGESVPVDPR